MSQEFLNRLLGNPENYVHADCMICLEKYNTLNTSTGVVEREIRLPCGHGVGSSCIVIWLQANNNCPACRAIFFPAQPRPYLEHGVMGSDTLRMAGFPTRNVELTHLLNLDLSIVFGDPDLPEDVQSVARSMAGYLTNYVQTQDHQSMAAASIYMASHLLHHPKTLEEISRVSGVDPDQIRSVYRQGYPSRMQLISVNVLQSIAGDYVEGMLAFLPPPGENGSIDSKARMRNFYRQHSLYTHHLTRLETPTLCLYYSRDLGGLQIMFAALEIIKNETLLQDRLGVRFRPLEAAVAVYMATHLLGDPVSYRRIADLVGVREGNIRTAYARLYPVRDQLIKPTMLPHIVVHYLPRALQALPALEWPPI